MSAPPRVAIVTAASKGIGAGCARLLAARGYRVVVMARSDAIETLAREIGAIAVQGSITEPADLERLTRTTLDTFGRIDAVVNNSGHPQGGDLLSVPDARIKVDGGASRAI